MSRAAIEALTSLLVTGAGFVMSADCALTMLTGRQKQATSKTVARLILLVFMVVGVRLSYNFRKTGISTLRISDLFV